MKKIKIFKLERVSASCDEYKYTALMPKFATVRAAAWDRTFGFFAYAEVDASSTVELEERPMYGIPVNEELPSDPGRFIGPVARRNCLAYDAWTSDPE